MGNHENQKISSLLGDSCGFLCRCLFSVLSYGPIPSHIAFIMDGNRRFSKSRNMKQGTGHKAGFTTLISILQHCYVMGVKYVTVYAFSIDNFRRKPEEVQSAMDLMHESINKLMREESIINKYGVRINFWGDMKLLSEPLRLSAENAMASTARNTGRVLSVCVAYNSTYEIMHGVQESILEKKDEIVIGQEKGYCNDLNTEIDPGNIVSVEDLEQHLYTADCPEPDIMIRTSGETRLSNFLLWQTTYSHLQNPSVLWPEFSLRHLVWAILEYQKVHPYLEQKKKNSDRKERLKE